jgi:DNA primase
MNRNKVTKRGVEMDAKQINATFDLLSLVEGLQKVGAYHVGACPFCGGKDRFTIKHTPDGDRWHCRQCGDGKYHTVIDFIMRRDEVGFKEALQMLGGEAGQHRLNPARQIQTPPKNHIELPTAETQAKMSRVMDMGVVRLESSAGQRAQAFLRKRGLLKHTLQMFNLGFISRPEYVNNKVDRFRPAISIPWYDSSSAFYEHKAMMGIKFRFIDDEPIRYKAFGDDKFLLFGLWDALPESHDTLLLIEGEFNCMSVWQCRPQGVTCLSFGSESGGSYALMQTIAQHYESVFVWADDVWDNPKKTNYAKNLKALVKGNGIALRSVIENNVKHDANELLMRGYLHGFLSHVLGVECLGVRGE